MDTKPTEFWSQTIEEITGEQVMMNTAPCVTYKMEKNNCKGCLYELNCAKLSSIIMVQHHAIAYKPADFLGHIKANMLASAMMEDIINAKSIEEIDKIILGEKEEKWKKDKD